MSPSCMMCSISVLSAAPSRYLSICSFSLALSAYLSLPLVRSLDLSFVCSVFLSFSLSLSVSIPPLSLFVYPSLPLPIALLPSLSPSLYLSIYLYIYIYIYISCSLVLLLYLSLSLSSVSCSLSLSRSISRVLSFVVFVFFSPDSFFQSARRGWSFR